MTVAELQSFVDDMLSYNMDAAQRDILADIEGGRRIRVKAVDVYGELIFVPEETSSS